MREAPGSQNTTATESEPGSSSDSFLKWEVSALGARIPAPPAVVQKIALTYWSQERLKLIRSSQETAWVPLAPMADELSGPGPERNATPPLAERPLGEAG
jgi:hypothetical protein